MKTTYIYAGAAVAGLAALWYFSRDGKAAQAGNAVVQTGGEFLGGLVGIPATNQTQCEKDRAAGDWWAASFSCPATDFVGGVTAAPVYAVGDAVGVPRTNQTQCDKDLEAGRMWDASFSCPAGRFLGGVWNSTVGNAAAQRDARLTDSILYTQAYYG
jgi:hypothetical protein